MARTFRRPRQLQPIAELNVTNLIDLGFTLLIIFMIATPLITQDQTIAVNLPVESQRPQAKPDPNDRFATIAIKVDGTYSLDGRPLSITQLSRELAGLAAQPKPPVIRIKGDANAHLQQLITLWSELEKNHLQRVSLDTKIAAP
jgi:biopolymer transport protein TolR